MQLNTTISHLNLFLLFLLLFVSTGEIISQTIITDRPDQTESSSTIQKGVLQIESGVVIQYTEAGNERIRNILAPTNLFRLGLTDGIELRILNQVEQLKLLRSGRSFEGLSDLEIGTKIQLYQKEDVNTEIAFLSHLICPTGSKDLTIDGFGTINKLSIAHSLTDDIGVGYNVGYDYFAEGSGNLTYSLAIGFGLTSKLSVYIEPYGAIVEFEEHEASFDAGITFLTSDNFQLDFSFGTGLNYTMNYVSFGFSWRIMDENKE